MTLLFGINALNFPLWVFAIPQLCVCVEEEEEVEEEVGEAKGKGRVGGWSRTFFSLNREDFASHFFFTDNSAKMT